MTALIVIACIVFYVVVALFVSALLTALGGWDDVAPMLAMLWPLSFAALVIGHPSAWLYRFFLRRIRSFRGVAG